MKRLICVALPVVLSVVVVMAAQPRAAEKEAAAVHQAHMVFFALKDHSASAREKFVASCQKYLSGHEGVLYFSVGTIAEDAIEPGVGVKDFDCALHLVFESREAGARYLKHPRHVQFVEENKASFDKVRVFDSYLAPTK